MKFNNIYAALALVHLRQPPSLSAGLPPGLVGLHDVADAHLARLEDVAEVERPHAADAEQDQVQNLVVIASLGRSRNRLKVLQEPLKTK